jgi:very-short-patch-repair endonuclease
MAQIFISYASKDHFFVDRLRADLRRAGLDYWIDREGLSPGTPSWERAIREALESCESVLWIVSPAAFDSPYVRDEISIARLHKRRIYPIFADGEHWLECVPIGTGEIQYIDARTDYDAALKRIIEALGAPASPYIMPEEPVPEPPRHAEPRNPYKGLSAFTEADAGDFFGREALVEKLHTRITSALKHKGDRLLAVLGPSGAGKSSVVMAGLIPALKKAHSGWAFLPKMAPGKRPVESLAGALYNVLPDKSLSSIQADLEAPGGRMLHRLAQHIRSEQVVLYIDQFEELFTETDDEHERQQFISLIVQAAAEPDGKVIVLLSMRADFYGHPLNYPQLGRLIEANNAGVLPMSITELRDAIEKPARLPDVGLTFDDGLVAEIIFALRDRKGVLAGALPLLEFTLTRLFAQRDGPRLTFAAYREMGGVDGAIGTHSEAVFQSLPEAAQAKLGQVFLPLVNIDETTGEPTRRRASLAALTADASAKAFVQAFVKARLLQTGHDETSPLPASVSEHSGEMPEVRAYLEVAHEALFRSWERLADWIAKTQEDLILLRQVRSAAHDWHAKGRPDFLRWPAERLELVYAMLERLKPELNDIERDFIELEQHRLYRELGFDVHPLPDGQVDVTPAAQIAAATHQRRYDIGIRLHDIGDIRRGVGVINGLPDILWLPVEGSKGKFQFKNQRGKVYGEFEVKPFFIAKYLVTVPQLQAFLDSDWDNPLWWDGFPSEFRPQAFRSVTNGRANAPRDAISWYQSVAFARWVDAKYRDMGLFEQFEALTPNPSPQGEGLKDYREMAAKVMVEVARDLRQRQTSAEALLWECLRDGRLNNLKFRRQHPVPNTAFVVDFYCHEAGLIIEIEGGIHENQRVEDHVRQQALEDKGLRVMRFANDDVFNQLEGVLIDIQRAASAPLSQGRGAGGEGWQIRLPTEWEWRWAAQAGAEERAYPWGDWDGHPRVNTVEAGIQNRSTAVGMYPHGAAACSALDMAGNLWEWCLNKYAEPEVCEVDASSDLRVLRGGSFYNPQDRAAASYRHLSPPYDRYLSNGLRLVLGSPMRL